MGTYLWEATATDVVAELLDNYEQRTGPGAALVDYDLNALSGELALYSLNWCDGHPACGTRPRCPGGLWIGVDLIKVEGRMAGHKPMDESMGPYAAACPLEWLSEPRLMPARGFAIEYRERVRAFWLAQPVVRYRHWSWPGVWPDWAGVGWPDLSGRLRAAPGGAS